MRLKASVSDDSKNLVSLVRQGGLFELQRFREEGGSLMPGDLDSQESLLYLSVNAGFRSLTEWLITAAPWNSETLNFSLSLSISKRRDDLSEMLLAAGAELKEVEFEVVCTRMRYDWIERYLREGGDPKGFGYALFRTGARPLVGVLRRLGKVYPPLQAEAAFALTLAVQHRKMRLIALLRWGGADPFRETPDPQWGDMTSAAHKSALSSAPEILPALKLRPSDKRAADLLYSAAIVAGVKNLRYILSNFSMRRINDGPHGTCRALNVLLTSTVFNFRGYGDREFESYVSRQHQQVREAIDILVGAGAKWVPRDSDINDARRALRQGSNEHAESILLAMLDKGYVEPAFVKKLFQAKSIAERIQGHAPKLWKRLKMP